MLDGLGSHRLFLGAERAHGLWGTQHAPRPLLALCPPAWGRAWGGRRDPAGALPGRFGGLRGRTGRHWPLAVLQADCGSPVWPARGSSFEAGYCREMPHGKAGGGRGAGGGRRAGVAAGRPAVSGSPRCQATRRSRVARCPAWTASPASWTASLRRRSRGCPSVTPAPSRQAPASTRGPGRPARRRPDGPTRRYEGPGPPPVPGLTPAASRPAAPQNLSGGRGGPGSAAVGVGGDAAARSSPGGSGRVCCPGNPAANKACYHTAGSPGASLTSSPGARGGPAATPGPAGSSRPPHPRGCCSGAARRGAELRGVGFSLPLRALSFIFCESGNSI